jgi:hypothetical protein
MARQLLRAGEKYLIGHVLQQIKWVARYQKAALGSAFDFRGQYVFEVEPASRQKLEVRV